MEKPSINSLLIANLLPVLPSLRLHLCLSQSLIKFSVIQSKWKRLPPGSSIPPRPFSLKPSQFQSIIQSQTTLHTHLNSTQASPKSTQHQPEHTMMPTSFTTPAQTDRQSNSPNSASTQASTHRAASMIFQGQKYVTSPIIYKTGDMTFWRHHPGLLIQVQVNKVYICNPIKYDIMLLHDHTIYEDEYADLFFLNSDINCFRKSNYGPISTAPYPSPDVSVSIDHIVSWMPT